MKTPDFRLKGEKVPKIKQNKKGFAKITLKQIRDVCFYLLFPTVKILNGTLRELNIIDTKNLTAQ